MLPLFWFPLLVLGRVVEAADADGRPPPLLGDIPVLGERFKNTTTNFSETDLVIVITPWLLTPVGR